VTNLDSVLDYFEAILWFTRLGLGWNIWLRWFKPGREIIW